MEASEQVCVLVDIEAGNATERRMYCSRSSFLVLDTQLNESLSGWNTVSMGSQHQCAISTENKMYCKGGNQYSQAGGETVNVVNWGTVGDKKDRWKDVAAGDVSSCAVRMDGSLWCWGAENAGLEGIASTNSKNPIQIGSQNNWESVNSSPNSRSFCAYTIAGAIYCWGDNRQGQLGFTRGDKSEPYRVTSPRATGWLNVELGENHSCALQNDGNMFCWGANQALKSLVNNSALIPHYASGQLGSKFVSQTVTATLSYLPFQTTPNIVVSRGLEYASTVQENWGLTPNWTEMSIFSQGNTVAGLQNDNDTYAWGSNQYSNLGIIESLVTNCNSPTRTEISGPVEVATLESWNQLSPSHSHSCARGNIQQNGGASLFCWGNNAYGQLGDGTSNGCRNKTTSNTEVYPEGSTTNPAYWVFVSSGANFSCAIDIDNKLQCWGDNSQGQLGVENIASANTPRQIDSADDYFTASAGTTHACAINFTGQLKCWGSNKFGQVGNASQTLQATPDLITLPSSFSSDAWTYIDTENHHSCGIIDDQFKLSL